MNVKHLSILGMLLSFLVAGPAVACRNDFLSEGSQPSHSVILEITSETSQTVYPKGKVLELRVYDDRKVEFDFYLPNTPDRFDKPFSCVVKNSNLNNDEYNSLVDLLQQADLLEARTHYSATRPVLDATIKKVIVWRGNGETRQIVLEENDSHLHVNERAGVYPSSLIKLLNNAREINRRLRKEIDPESR